MGPQPDLPVLVRVVLRLTTMKEFSSLLKAPALESHSQM